MEAPRLSTLTRRAQEEAGLEVCANLCEIPACSKKRHGLHRGAEPHRLTGTIVQQEEDAGGFAGVYPTSRRP